jgi:hypothetical protein
MIDDVGFNLLKFIIPLVSYSALSVISLTYSDASMRVSHQAPLSLFTNKLITLALALFSTMVNAESESTYIERFSCIGGSLGLHLPNELPSLIALKPIIREEVHEVESWDGYTATHKHEHFPGFTLGIITFSNDSNRFMVSFAEITSRKWSHISPFYIGENISSARRKIGAFADNDPYLKKSYGSEDGDVSFQTYNGKIKKIIYTCYTG